MSQSPLIVKYERILVEDPRSRAFAPLAEAYRKVGLIDKAFEVLKKGIRYNPEYIMGYLSLSQCYFEKGEYALAYTTLRPISAKNRDNLKLQKLYGEVCSKTQNYEEALDTYKYLLFLNPRDLEISGKVLKLEKMLSESAVTADSNDISFDIENLSPSPENDRALDDWIQIDLSRQSVEEVEDRSVGNDFDSSEDWQESSSSLEELEYTEEESTSTLLTANEVGDEEEEEIDDTPVITHTLVDLYLNQGHTQKAIEILEKIIKIQPDNQDSINRLSLLTALDPEFENDDIEDIRSKASDEGHSMLSAVLDVTLSEDSFNSEYFEHVDEVLSDFLNLLRTKSGEYSLKS